MSSNSRSVSSSVTSPGSLSGSRQASANFLSGDRVLRTTRAAPLPEPHSGVSRASRLQGPSSAIAGKAAPANRVAIARAGIVARMVGSLSRDSRAAQRIEVPDHVGDSCFGCPSVGQPAESCLAFAVRPGSDLGNRFAGKFVGAFVEIVTGMTAHPMPMHSVAADRGLESLPQIRVLDRLLVAGPPAVAFPALDPARDSLA